MKIAIVSDIHGNLPALEAVIADLAETKPDLVVHGGDLALNGAQPAECVDLVREAGWPGIRGNTDDVICGGPAPLPHRLIIGRLTSASRHLLGEERVAWLRELPMSWRDEDRVALVHAVPGNLWRIVPKDAPDAKFEATYGPLHAAIAVYCHIHRPFQRSLAGFTIANSGSVGQPLDGDWRSAYLLITDGSVEIRRVEYDLEREVAALKASRYPGADLLAKARRSGG